MKKESLLVKSLTKMQIDREKIMTSNSLKNMNNCKVPGMTNCGYLHDDLSSNLRINPIKLLDNHQPVQYCSK